MASKPAHPTATSTPSIPPNAESHNITRVTAALLDVAGSYVILCELKWRHTQSGLSDMTAMYHTTNRGQGMLTSHHIAHHTSHRTHHTTPHHRTPHRPHHTTPQDTTPHHTTPHHTTHITHIPLAGGPCSVDLYMLSNTNMYTEVAL